jgi:hypothetical protein
MGDRNTAIFDFRDSVERISPVISFPVWTDFSRRWTAWEDDAG